MKKYEIEMSYDYSTTLEIEVNNESEARDKAESEFIDTILDGHTVEHYNCVLFQSLKCNEDNIDKDADVIYEDIQNEFEEIRNAN